MNIVFILLISIMDFLEPLPTGDMENYEKVVNEMTICHYIDFPKKLQKYFSKEELSNYDILSDLLKEVTLVLFWEITFLNERESNGLQVGIFFYTDQRDGKADMKKIHQAILETANARVVARNELLKNIMEPLLQRFPYDIALKIAEESVPAYHEVVKVEEKSWD